MNKKELLLIILGKLQKYWSLAEGLKSFVESDYIGENDINNILLFINSKVKNLKVKQQKKQKEELKIKIAKEEEKEKKELDEIENLLDTIEW